MRRGDAEAGCSSDVTLMRRGARECATHLRMLFDVRMMILEAQEFIKDTFRPPPSFFRCHRHFRCYAMIYAQSMPRSRAMRDAFASARREERREVV